MENFVSVQKQELLERLLKVESARITAFEAAAAFNALCREGEFAASVPCWERSVQMIYQAWLDEHIAQYTAAGQGVSYRTISRSDLSPQFLSLESNKDDHPDRHHRSGRDCSEPESLTSIRNMVADFDFEGLFAELAGISESLEEKGLSDVATELAERFYLVDQYKHRVKKIPKYTKGGWLINLGLYSEWGDSYSFSTLENIHKAPGLFEVVERESGVEGLSGSMRTIAAAFGSYRLIDSRTKLAEGMKLEATVFKERLQIRLSHEVADALFAFCKMYSSKALNTDIFSGAA